MATVDVDWVAGQSQTLGTPGDEGNEPPPANPNWTAPIPTCDSAVCWDWLHDTVPAPVVGPLVEPYPTFPTENNRYRPQKASLNPAFANAFTSASGRPLLIVRTSIGGTPLLQANATGNQNWSPTGVLFNQAANRVIAAINALTGAGHTIGHVFMVWSQGYRDAFVGNNLTGTGVGSYYEGQVQLLARVRAALTPVLGATKANTVQVYTEENYAPEAATPAVALRCGDVRTAQLLAIANTPGLHNAFNLGSTFNRDPDKTVAGDHLHASQKGLNIMGLGFATYILNDLEFGPPDPPDPPTDPAAGRVTSHIAHRLWQCDPFVRTPPVLGDPASFVDAAGAGVASSTPTVNAPKPSGSGGKLVAVCAANNTNVTWTPPAGWTAVPGGTHVPVSIATFEHVADVGDPATFAFGRSSNVSGASVEIVRVADAGLIAAQTSPAGIWSGSGDATLSEIIAASDNTLLLQVVVGLVSGTRQWTPPVGTTERTSDPQTTGTSYGYAVGDEVVDAGATGPRAWDNGGTGASKGVMLAIGPA